MNDSTQAAWWPVHEFLAELLTQANRTPPAAGTPAWCALDDADPLKLLSLAMEGERIVLHRELRQESLADASKAIAAAANWPQAARELQQLAAARKSGSRIERKDTAA